MSRATIPETLDLPAGAEVYPIASLGRVQWSSPMVLTDGATADVVDWNVDNYGVAITVRIAGDEFLLTDDPYAD